MTLTAQQYRALEILRKRHSRRQKYVWLSLIGFLFLAGLGLYTWFHFEDKVTDVAHGQDVGRPITGLELTKALDYFRSARVGEVVFIIGVYGFFFTLRWKGSPVDILVLKVFEEESLKEKGT